MEMMLFQVAVGLSKSLTKRRNLRRLQSRSSTKQQLPLLSSFLKLLCKSLRQPPETNSNAKVLSSSESTKFPNLFPSPQRFEIPQRPTSKIAAPNAKQHKTSADSQVYRSGDVERVVHTTGNETERIWEDKELQQIKKQHSKLGCRCSYGWH